MRALTFPFLVLLFIGSIVSADTEQPTKLQIDVVELPKNCEEKAATGDKISVHYTGTLFANGNKFDSSLDRGAPFPLTLGIGQVIPGWDEGLQGMCVGEKRKLTIPSIKAYGSRGFGKIIPPDSALIFDVELLKLDKSSSRDEL